MTCSLRATGLLSLLLAVPAHAGFGDRDCSYGAAGIHTLQANSTFGVPFNFVYQPDGLVWLRNGYLSTSAELFLVNAEGTGNLSSRFANANAGTAVTDPALVKLSSGKLLLLTRGGILRYDRFGALDSSFGASGIATVGGFEALTGPVVQDDGRMLAAGRLGGVAAIVRFNSDGSPDGTFGSGGVLSDAAAGTLLQSMTLQSDGSVVVASSTTLSRYDANGSIDATFGSNGRADVSLQLTVAQVRLQPSGKILVVGTNDVGSDQYRIRLVRLTTNGALDLTVGGGSGYRDVEVSSVPLKGDYSPWLPLVLLPDGRPLIVGRRPTPSGTEGAIVRYGVDLTDDAVAILDFAPATVFPLPSGRLLAGGLTETGKVRRLLGDADAPTCTTTTTVLSSSPNPSNFGQSVTLSATVTQGSGVATPTGSVQFFDGATLLRSVSLSGGVATASINTLVDGAHSLTAVYQGANTFIESTSAAIVHNVNVRPPTTTTVSTSPNPSTSGQAVTLTATVTPSSGSGTPTGQVQFKDGASNLGVATSLSSGVATLVTSLIPDGSRSITAVYAGDANFAPSTSPAVTHVVPGRLTINDPTANAALGPTNMTFAVALTAAATVPVTVSYATADHSAHEGVDYTAISGSLTFNPGETSLPLVVPIAGQTVPGPNKDFFLTLTNPTNASFAKGAGIGTIAFASTGALSAYIDDPSVAEGYSGTTLLGFTVSLSRPATTTETITYSTASGTAVAGVDFTDVSGTLQFVPGQSQRWVVVPIAANSTLGSNRSFFVNISSSSSAVVVKGQGTGTIIEDDPTPAAATVVQYRLYSEVTKEHLYTTDSNEYAVLATRGWTQEGVAYTMFQDGGSRGGQYAIPLYRMYHRGIQQHHWTTDTNEVVVLARGTAWNYEGIAGYVLPAADTDTTPLYRLRLNSPPLHLWTTDLNEKTILSTQRGWVFEGIVGEVIP